MKRQMFTLLCSTALMYTIAVAQPAITKQADAGSGGINHLTCMAITRDTGAIVGGYSYGNTSCQKSENNRDTTEATMDYWIVKYNTKGNIQWDKTLGGSNNDRPTTVLQTYDGGYIIGGSSFSDKSGDKTEDSRGMDDYWVIKLSAKGHIQWQKTLGGNQSDVLYSIEQTGDSGYVIRGTSQSGKSGDKTTDAIGAWTVQLDKNGKILWDKVLPGLQPTTDGGYIFVGGSGITKRDSLGNIVWSKDIGQGSADLDHDGDDDGYLYLVEQTDDGGYITGGRLGPASGPFEGVAFWVIKTDSLGNRQWGRTLGYRTDDAYNILTSLHQTSDHGYILGGKAENPDHDYDYDYLVYKLDSNGKYVWDIETGGHGAEDTVMVEEIGKDRYLVGGTSSADIGRDKTVPVCNTNNVPYYEIQDYWVLVLANLKSGGVQSASVGSADKIATSKLNNSGFSVYPNPARDKLHVQVKGTAALSLTDAAGRTLFTQTITNSGNINVAGLQAGIYYLQNRATGETKKVVVVR